MSTAPTIIADHLAALRQLCRQHHVARLELFGSATTAVFDDQHSDLDFLVDTVWGVVEQFLPVLHAEVRLLIGSDSIPDQGD
jgi:predicted nucleotidyltransferase